MRYLVMSDIHGGGEELEEVLGFFESWHCDCMVLLGDLLNHGPRNRVPGTYAPPRAAELLNRYNRKIISIRGNCDSEVDQMMFSFPCNAPYGYIHIPCDFGIQKIFLTHGHLYNFDRPGTAAALGLGAGDIVLSGHTHVSGIFERAAGVININPGSTTIPKGGTQPGFGRIDPDRITLFNLGGEALAEYVFRPGSQNA